VKIYVSARYSRKLEVADVAAALELAGFEVTSTWHEEPHDGAIEIHELTADQRREYAARDLAEVDAAHILLLFSESDQTFNRRGGRHVEFGYALGVGKAIAVVGPQENIFHHLSWVKHHDTLEDFIMWALRKRADDKSSAPLKALSLDPPDLPSKS
jgi:hypothetical protein